MTDTRDGIELAIDTAGSPAGIAISRQGGLLVELSWRTQNNHSAELLPAIDQALTRAGADRSQIQVIFVNRGPGGYAGLRVGIGTAMGLALGLEASLLALGRLELDALPFATFPGPVCAVHQAGRGDVAWAVYEAGAEPTERVAPAITSLETMIAEAPPLSLFCGETAGIAEQILAARPRARFAAGPACLRRPAALAELGWRRYSAGERDNPFTVQPLYLREPSITPPRPRQPQFRR